LNEPGSANAEAGLAPKLLLKNSMKGRQVKGESERQQCERRELAKNRYSWARKDERRLARGGLCSIGPDC
jgi:hypothetical protein